MTLERGGQLWEIPGKEGPGLVCRSPGPRDRWSRVFLPGHHACHSCLCTSRSQVCHLYPESILQESNLFLCSKSLPYECVDKHEFPMSTEHPEKEPETLIGVTSGKESLVLWNQDKTISYGLSWTLELALIHLNKHLGKHYYMSDTHLTRLFSSLKSHFLGVSYRYEGKMQSSRKELNVGLWVKTWRKRWKATTVRLICGPGPLCPSFFPN